LCDKFFHYIFLYTGVQSISLLSFQKVRQEVSGEKCTFTYNELVHTGNGVGPNLGRVVSEEGEKLKQRKIQAEMTVT
jgi:hypothetical protein